MIQEDYCSFEVAMLLEEKGFEVSKLESGFKTVLELASGIYSVYTTVTHALAMKWLREKGIYLNIRVALNRIEDNVINNIHWVVDILDFNNGEWKDNDIWVDTYEEAVEAALLYVLKNLI